MPDYKYVAKNADGETVRGVLQAQSESVLARAIRDQGMYLLSSEDATPQSNILQDLFTAKMSTKELAIFCRQVAAMLNAGVTLIRSLDIFYQQATQNHVKEIVRKLYEDVQRGDMFSDALKKQGRIFPPLMISIIESGEASGTLERSVERMAVQFENDEKLRGKIISAMVYPSVLAVLAVGAVIVMLVVVLPTFVGIFESTGAELPGPTRFILSLSNFLTVYWPIILALIVALVFGIMLYSRSKTGKRALDGFLLKIPAVNTMIARVAASRFTRTMANLTSSGLPLLSALEITSRVVGNQAIGEKILTVRDEVRTGIPLSTATRQIDEFPPLVYSMISIGEESGSLSELLDRVSIYLDEEVDSAVQRLLSLLEPALMVFMAVVIGYVVIAIMMPIFGIYNQIG